jgi:uncharacterized damage-inducible protein DinB
MERMSDPRFPIGRFSYVPAQSAGERKQRIDTLRALPQQITEAVAGLTDAQLDTPYREGGWTVRQLLHHIPDSHLNAYVRLKLALTENNPTIKAYDEAAWAKLPDSAGPVEPSLQLLEALHTRWTALLDALTDEQWQRTLQHPEAGPMTLDKALGLYEWHSRHHLAHIKNAPLKQSSASV